MRNLLFVFSRKTEIRPIQFWDLNVSLDTGVPARSTGRTVHFYSACPGYLLPRNFIVCSASPSQPAKHLAQRKSLFLNKATLLCSLSSTRVAKTQFVFE